MYQSCKVKTMQPGFRAVLSVFYCLDLYPGAGLFTNPPLSNSHAAMHANYCFENSLREDTFFIITHFLLNREVTWPLTSECFKSTCSRIKKGEPNICYAWTK